MLSLDHYQKLLRLELIQNNLYQIINFLQFFLFLFFCPSITEVAADSVAHAVLGAFVLQVQQLGPAAARLSCLFSPSFC